MITNLRWALKGLAAFSQFPHPISLLKYFTVSFLSSKSNTATIPIVLITVFFRNRRNWENRNNHRGEICSVPHVHFCFYLPDCYTPPYFCDWGWAALIRHLTWFLCFTPGHNSSNHFLSHPFSLFFPLTLVSASDSLGNHPYMSVLQAALPNGWTATFTLSFSEPYWSHSFSLL